MQSDMHFYGTFVLARAAGIPFEDAHTIAYSAQFVDDSTRQDSKRHQDGGLLYGIATAHHDKQCVYNSVVEPEEQRRVWVPFHFLPGGEGDTLEKRLLCVKDSEIAQEMFRHHIDAACHRDFRFELLGIASHVYMDTFSHYGFSGIGSEYNNVDADTIELIDVKNQQMEQYLLDKRGKFVDKYKLRSVASFMAEFLTGGLGHGGVATYPDRPFLHWRVTFENARPSNGTVSDRDNPKTFLEGCGKLHEHLSSFAQKYYANAESKPFAEIKDQVDVILRFEGNEEDRIGKWKSAIESGAIYPADPSETEISYDAKDWEGDKIRFHTHKTSTVGIESHAYRFHQAAALHRYYVLKELLPAHGIAVY